MCFAHQTGMNGRKFRSTTTVTQRRTIVCRSTPPTLPCGLTSLANRQRPLRSMWGQIDGYGCASSSIGASSKFSRITGSARQNGRSRRKGIDKIFPLFSRQCAVARAYPEREDSNGISLFSIGGEAQIVSLDVWQMRSIWPELKYREGT